MPPASLKAPAVPDYWTRAKRELSRTDPALGRLIRKYPGIVLQSRGEPFVTLVRSIVGQQISVKAADAVWGRLQAAVPRMSPRTILATPEDTLRAAGLSVRTVASTAARASGIDRMLTPSAPALVSKGSM